MNVNSMTITWCAVAAFAGCASPGLLAQETVGQKFRKVLSEIDAECRRDRLGPYLDPSDPEYLRKRRGTDCDILRLEPRDWRTEKMSKTEGQLYPIPERWLATPEGRFAHSIKLPPPHDKPKDVYRRGMNTKEYFEALCKEEAGDFVFRSVEGVQGVLRARAPEIENDDVLRHIFAPEAPVGLPLWPPSGGKEDIGQVFVQPVHGRYQYAESRSWPNRTGKGDALFRKFVRDPARATGQSINYTPIGGTYSVPNEVVENGVERATSKYAFIWRGIVRPNDRELGIAGGEFVVFDRDTSEALGVRRVFRATNVGKRGAWWLTAANCSRELATLPAQFVYLVLIPTQSFSGREK
jgi:hypothetical protein